MRKNKEVPRKFCNKTFDPDKIATTVHQAITRDLVDNRVIRYPREVHDLLTASAQTLKKYVRTDNDIDLDEKTYSKFKTVNKHMQGFRSHDWFPQDTLAHPRHGHIQRALLRARSLCHMVLGPLEMDELLLECKNSGGVSLGVPFRDTSVERKFTFPITVSESCVPYLIEALNYDFLLVKSVVKYNSEFPLGNAFEKVESSRATTVPKTNSINRMIAIEPTGNMYIQQGAMKVMYRRLAAVGLDVATLPDKHVELAREGSISKNLATIDFSSASDCLSIELLEFLLPSAWFELLNDIRCKTMTLHGSTTALNMFSTMGNATTFPLETLVFYSLSVAAVMRQSTSPSLLSTPRQRASVSVFGDDCILPTAHAPFFMELAVSVGFLVNSEKSHFEASDNFRESCGGDFLSGMDVRPLFLKPPSSTKLSALEPWLYIILNRGTDFYRKVFGDTSYIYSHFFRYVVSLFERHHILVKCVPPEFPDDAGYSRQDYLRLARAYKCKFAKLKIGKNGVIRFPYCRFRYRKCRDQCEEIRYALALKKGYAKSTMALQGHLVPVPSDPLPSFSPIRHRGGYVVAKGLTVHWTVDRPT